ncbi:MULTISPECIES: helix-turn-helix domain-containing protein [Falsihalocynthiibacter]|uniref:helix-turn-helix domain-containing protein n=1 Tax=Falsihalocynthiibacter TaxID=2854182 RepID=UPI0030026F7F
MAQREFIRMCEIPKVYGISKDTVNRAIKAKKITRHKLGRATLIRCQDLSDWITGKAEQPDAVH